MYPKHIAIASALLCVTAISSTAVAGTESRCREDLSRDGWTVVMSHKYNEVDVAIVAACIVGTGGAGTLPCLGDALYSVAETIGWDLLTTAIENRGKIVFGPGGLRAQAGICSKTYPIAFGLRGTDHYVYLRYKRAGDGGPAGPDWQPIPGSATDIGAGGIPAVIGTDRRPGGYGIYSWTGSGWHNIPGGAVAIDTDPDGNAWVVNESGDIFRQQGDDWAHVPGSARDIGVGSDGSVYIIGTNRVAGGYGIWRFNGSGWDAIDGGAVRIAVGPDGQPVVANDAGHIFQRRGNRWHHLPGLAYDVGVGGDGVLWVIGTNPVAGGYGIHRFDGANWHAVSGGAVRIAVDRWGTPWVINNGGAIFEGR